MANGKTEQVIAQLLSLSSNLDKELQEDILMQSSRFKAFQKEKRQGTISNEELQVTLNKINSSLLEIIHQLPETNPVIRQNSTSRILKLLGAIAAIVAFIAAVVQISGYSLRDIFEEDSDKIEISAQEQQEQDKIEEKLPPPNTNETTSQEKQFTKDNEVIAKVDKFTFRGVAKDASGFLKDVYIRIGNQSVYTDENGEFEINNATDEELRLEAIKPDYETYSTRTIPRDDIIITLVKSKQ